MAKKDDKTKTDETEIPTDEKGRVTKPHVPADDGEGWEFASAQIWEPEPGDIIQGIYDGSEPFTEGTLDTEVLKHFINTPKDGRFSFVGGAVFDKAIKSNNITPGLEVRIKFQGKKDLKKEGRRVNLFEIKYRTVK